MRSLVEPKSLLVEIPVKMRRVNTDISALEGSLQETPEILDVVGVNVAANKLDRVIDHLVRICIGKTEIRFQSISVEVRACLDSCTDFGRQRIAADIWDVHGLDPAWPLVAAALYDAENGLLAGTAGASDLPLLDVPVHVFRKPANE